MCHDTTLPAYVCMHTIIDNRAHQQDVYKPLYATHKVALEKAFHLPQHVWCCVLDVHDGYMVLSSIFSIQLRSAGVSLLSFVFVSCDIDASRSVSMVCLCCVECVVCGCDQHLSTITTGKR